MTHTKSKRARLKEVVVNIICFIVAIPLSFILYLGLTFLMYIMSPGSW